MDVKCVLAMRFVWVYEKVGFEVRGGLRGIPRAVRKPHRFISRGVKMLQNFFTLMKWSSWLLGLGPGPPLFEVEAKTEEGRRLLHLKGACQVLVFCFNGFTSTTLVWGLLRLYVYICIWKNIGVCVVVSLVSLNTLWNDDYILCLS